MAIHCEFGATLDDALRDQFVTGLQSEAMHKWLLTEDKLTLSRAVQISTGMETAAKSAKGFQESDSLTVKQVGRTFINPGTRHSFEALNNLNIMLLDGLCPHASTVESPIIMKQIADSSRLTAITVEKRAT